MRVYAVHWGPLPNLAQDLIVPPLARLMAARDRVEAVPGDDFRRDCRRHDLAQPCCHGRLAALAAACVPAALQSHLPVGLCQLPVWDRGRAGRHRVWLALEPRGWWIRVLLSSLAALACYFSHVAAFGFYALVIFGVEAAPAFTELRFGDWPALGRRTAIAGPQWLIRLRSFSVPGRTPRVDHQLMPGSCARPISCSVYSTITIAPLTSAVLHCFSGSSAGWP